MYTVLVVDDEKLIRKSIIKKLNGSPFEFKTIFESGSAKEALQFTDIDILITDIRMGGPSGLILARMMKQNNPSMKTIIISGYSEFSYATEALSIGVIEYLVKPINTEKLLSAVAKTIDLIDMEQEEKKSKEKVLIEESSSRLSSLFQNSTTHDAQSISSYISLRSVTCYMSLRLFVAIPNDNILYIVISSINESSFIFGYDIATYKDEIRQVGILIGFPTVPPSATVIPTSVSMLITKISRQLEERGMSNYTFGVSGLSNDSIVCYKQSLTAMYHRIIFPDNHLITFADCAEISETYTLSKDDKTKFLLLLSTQAIPSLGSFIDNIDDEIEKRLPIKYHNLQLLYNFFLDTIYTKFNYHPSSHASFLEPYHFNSIREITDFLKSFCFKAIESTGVKTNISRTVHLVWNLQSFIKEHFDQQFTLNLFCDQNNLNTSLFSSQFHQIAGVTFQNFLKTTRIEKAKDLLEKTDNKIGTVAMMCGFSDQRYFSKTFKQVTGFTPKEFQSREKRQDNK